MQFSDNIMYLKGVGEKRAKLYEKLGIKTVGELLQYAPRDYLDLREPVSADKAVLDINYAILATVSVKGSEQKVRSGLSIFKVQAFSGNTDIMLTFYNGKYTVQNLQVGEEYIFYGKVTGGLLKKEMSTPVVFPVNINGLVPTYRLTAGLTSQGIRKDIKTALSLVSTVPETLPPQLLSRTDQIPMKDAITQLHFPKDHSQASSACERLAFDELLAVSIGITLSGKQKNSQPGHKMVEKSLSPLLDTLPYTPTHDQQNAINSCMEDMQSGLIMNRLVQGDVGSGKTLVALACCYYCCANGMSAAMMAPTEILAEQHYKNIKPILEPLGVRVALLTGSLSAKKKKELKAEMAQGVYQLCIGTHALITEDTEIANLALVITDEQHRFGVSQRLALGQKGIGVHTMVLSATPIPRTLGLILYGDMKISVIRQMPRGRQPIATYLIDSEKRLRAWGYVKKHLDRGEQGYIVCPLVEDDPETNTAGRTSAIEWHDELINGYFSGYKVGLLHGKMKSKEKETVMADFASGEIHLLVATTVIEVGIDVANATIMMIENSECFGLSQLHQLRGRVGRGSEKSTCILVSDSRNPDTINRLRVICDSTDGFEIAEHDMAERGIGDFFGTRQHGVPMLGIASLLSSTELPEKARTLADYILEKDPVLHYLPVLAQKIDKLMGIAAVL